MRYADRGRAPSAASSAAGGGAAASGWVSSSAIGPRAREKRRDEPRRRGGRPGTRAGGRARRQRAETARGGASPSSRLRGMPRGRDPRGRPAASAPPNAVTWQRLLLSQAARARSGAAASCARAQTISTVIAAAAPLACFRRRRAAIASPCALASPCTRRRCGHHACRVRPCLRRSQPWPPAGSAFLPPLSLGRHHARLATGRVSPVAAPGSGAQQRSLSGGRRVDTINRRVAPEPPSCGRLALVREDSR